MKGEKEVPKDQVAERFNGPDWKIEGFSNFLLCIVSASAGPVLRGRSGQMRTATG